MLNGRSGWFLRDHMIVAADKVSPTASRCFEMRKMLSRTR